MINADPKELEKFSALAHRWWDLAGEFKPLHAINPLRMSWIAQHFSLQGARVIDVGCGGGILSESMARAGASVTGIDLAQEALGVAKLHRLESGLEIEYCEISAEALALEKPAHYDAVSCMEMLEHVPDPESIVKACAKLVKPGGPVFFSTINRTLKSGLFMIVGAEYLLRMLPRGTHNYARFIKPSELSHWCRNAGLTPIETLGIIYKPFTQSYQLDENVEVNYLLCAR